MEPLTKQISTTVDVSQLSLRKGQFVTIATDGNGCVEVARKEDGTLQVCVDAVTLKAGGVHSFEDIYGPDPA